jgi:hypothetical protein
VGSVRFGYDGNANYRTESSAPYALAGDTGGDYNVWTPTLGTHSLTATPYSGSGATGTAGTPLTVAFTVLDQAALPPAAPSNLAAVAVSSSQVNLSWTDNSGDEAGFKIERNTGTGGTYAQIATAGADVTSYQNTGLAASTTYVYRVRAYNSSGDSAWSNEVSATTPAAPAGPAIASFTLINADTDSDIGPLSSGAVLDFAALPTANLNIRANPSPATVGSVRFGYDANSNFRTENAAPYALAGDSGGNYAAWTPSAGTHSLTATPYSGSSASGTAGAPLTITFTIVGVPSTRALAVEEGVVEEIPPGEEPPPADTATVDAAAGDGGGDCGATGAEIFLVLGLLALRRGLRRRPMK